MAHVKTLNVSLTAELYAFITDRVASGRYGTASEVVRAALRTYERQEREHLLPARSANHDSRP